MVVAGRASGLNSLLSLNKVSLLTEEQTPRPCAGINNAEYKLISVPLMIVLLAVYIGYMEITPRPRTGMNNVE